MKTKRILSILAAVALTVSVSAQQSEHDNYVGVNFGGGLNSMLYKPANGTHGLGFGFDAGLHYGHFFNKTVGLGVGLQFSWANAYATYNWNEVTTDLTHANNPNTPYNLTTGFNDFKERQNIGYLSIPVEVLFRKTLNNRAAFIGGVGLALDLPLYGKYIAKSGSYSTTGVVPALADLGFRVAMNDNWGMYFGLYAGYGFTNLLGEEKTEEMIMINAENSAVIDYRGTFDSNETGKANLIRAGVKIAIDFGWGDHKSKAKEAERLAREMAVRDSIAAAEAQAKADSLAAAEAENARIAAAKAEQERIARERAAAEKARIAAEKAAQDAEAARIAAEKARIAALKSQGETVTVHFDIAGADMRFRDGEQAIVDEICHVMAADPSMKIVITGHTDNTGNAEQNLRYFGMKRAESLKNYMVEKGVPAGQIRCESKGQLEPVADNATRDGRAQNRRANIRFE